MVRPGSANATRRRGPQRVFTHYIRSLSAAGEPPDDPTFDGVWVALRGALVRELRRRGLWTSPPSYLGLTGWPDWSFRDDGNTIAPLEELLTDCYTFVFITRLRSLQSQLAVKSNIDGLVLLNIRHFLQERQKAHDPLGARLFQTLRNVMRQAVDSGELFVLAGARGISNRTVLGGDPAADPERAATRDELEPIVRRWNDDLLPDLVTAWGRGRQQIDRRLRSKLWKLPSEGVAAFAFKTLLDPLKADVRLRWASILGQQSGFASDGDLDLASLVREVRQDERLERRDAMSKLQGCVRDLLDKLEGRDEDRTHLGRLWGFLTTRAAGGGNRTIDGSLGKPPGGDEPLSKRRVSELLGIPRHRLPALYATLQQLVTDCRGATQRKDAVIDHPKRVGRSEESRDDE